MFYWTRGTQRNSYKTLKSKSRVKQQFASPGNSIIFRHQQIVFSCPASCENSRFLIGRANVCWADRHWGNQSVLRDSKLWGSARLLKLENTSVLESGPVGVHWNSRSLKSSHPWGAIKTPLALAAKTPPAITLCL